MNDQIPAEVEVTKHIQAARAAAKIHGNGKSEVHSITIPSELLARFQKEHGADKGMVPMFMSVFLHNCVPDHDVTAPDAFHAATLEDGGVIPYQPPSVH